MNRASTRPEGRLDELLNALDNASDRYGVKLTSTSAAYIASLLRAGRELRKANDVFAEEGDAELLDRCETDYDNAVRGEVDDAER